jgi:hypothetical protein
MGVRSIETGAEVFSRDVHLLQVFKHCASSATGAPQESDGHAALRSDLRSQKS